MTRCSMTRFFAWLAIGFGAGPLLIWSLAGDPVQAQAGAHPMLSPSQTFVETSGEEIYANVCQGCHMPDGKGAVGAGAYPALANNKNLESAGYPVYVVVNGSKGMPPVGMMMSDEQVAAVVNFVRTSFGNSYQDKVTAKDAKDARPEKK